MEAPQRLEEPIACLQERQKARWLLLGTTAECSTNGRMGVDQTGTCRRPRCRRRYAWDGRCQPPYLHRQGNKRAVRVCH